ncbi:hypothetical protein CcCBS67573_g07487 [Chytriomyces confervae]|uniref:Uncharacterized protein n=1 Tax=Chytriomyces confervae TaxID=246404 RepID=A0A507EUA8_9FUNG|nr:hypothetical protein HDU80_007358 [Chytriomyces hyalinus]TPX67461.1 hypothetical protein CcCBS67573_g07487 [Chytriomyces confervae]
MTRDTEQQGFAVSTNSVPLEKIFFLNQSASNESAYRKVTTVECEAFHPRSFKNRDWKEYVLPQDTNHLPAYWSRVTLVVILIASLLAAACESWIMINDFRLKARLIGQNKDMELFINKGFTIAEIYHGRYLAGFAFWFYVTWDGIMQKNPLQVISVNAYNVGLFVYSILQMQQIKVHLQDVRQKVETADPLSNNSGLYFVAQILLIVLLGVFMPVFAFLTVKLHLEFKWRQFRVSNGKSSVYNAFIAYHILLLTIKFGTFFMAGLVIINLVLTEVTRNGTIIIPVISVAVGILLPLIGFHGARRENYVLSSIFIFGCLGCLAFIVERVVQAFVRERENPGASWFNDAKLPFMMYAATTFMLVSGSLVYSIICMRNFKKGLKEALDREKLRNIDPSSSQLMMQPVDV